MGDSQDAGPKGLSDACGNVWAAFYSAHRPYGDVAVAASRSDDPREWRKALDGAFLNLELHTRESVRWHAIVKELLAEVEKHSGRADERGT
jgi:hypothetical protein